MPRKKRQIIEAGTAADGQSESASMTPPASTPPPSLDETPHPDTESAESTAPAAASRSRARSFKSTLSLPAKGVLLGERNGHDWVISFSGDPGPETKDRLREAGFEYRDRKWKRFTHAPNRADIETLARELKRQHGEEIAVKDYPTRQVVLAFDAPPGEEITKQLKEAGFHYRSDVTWNADFTAENQKFARDLIQSLPAQSRSAQADR